MRNRGRDETSRLLRKRIQEEEEEIIRVPAFDNSDLIEKFKLTLVGRMFHEDGRSVEALLKHMPKRRIWDVEGRVRGTNLGNNKFQFDFDKEEDLLKVQQRRPCHFNKWSFSLERWIPTIKEDFPNTLSFWAVVSGIPSHYKKEETYQSVGKALGIFEKADVEGGRVRICVNGDQPLKFECKVGFDNGDVVKVKIQYEDLYRHCFTCKRISHEEGTCPELTDGQKERKRVARIEQMEAEERANREAFSVPQRNRLESQRRVSPEIKRGRESYYKDDTSSRAWRRTPSEERRDLRNKLTEKRVTHSKNVWNRLDSVTPTQYQRANDRYHPYHKNSGGVGQRDKTRDTASSSEWRRKDLDKNSERYGVLPRKNPSRSRFSPDSQRTISEHLRPPSYRGNYGGRKSRSPPKYRTEWRPVSNPRSGGNMISTPN